MYKKYCVSLCNLPIALTGQACYTGIIKRENKTNTNEEENKMFTVYQLVEDACGYDSVVVAEVATEAEAQAMVEQLTAEYEAEWGEWDGEYALYSYGSDEE